MFSFNYPGEDIEFVIGCMHSHILREILTGYSDYRGYLISRAWMRSSSYNTDGKEVSGNKNRELQHPEIKDLSMFHKRG